MNVFETLERVTTTAPIIEMSVGKPRPTTIPPAETYYPNPEFDIFDDFEITCQWAIPKLPREEQIEKAISFQNAMISQHSLPEISDPKIKLELEQIIQKGKEDVNILFKSYGWFLFGEANKRAYRGLDIYDLIDEAYKGMVQGLLNFNPQRGYALSTYITPWMKTRMDRAIKNQTLPIDIPEHIQDRRAKYRRQINTLTNELKRYPRKTEAAILLKTTPEDMLTILNPVQQPTSLDREVTWENPTPLQDLIPDDNAINPEIALIQKQELESIREVTKSVLSVLPPRLARVFSLTYAFGETENVSDRNPRTCRAVQMLLEKEGIKVSKSQVAIDLQEANEIFKTVLKASMEQQ